ncbi:threonine synthase [Verrucomicrobiaceae bacterium N1E253]|uniref:Threonine synthase n=1 Tax=Oceaniferula marina TaxID=2748318 RepID=A0A851GET4_9BACT|nr:threonine synthase [Oceaniferula marina]NWK55699.1 threonine synthase [Oceaniferula marina]
MRFYSTNTPDTLVDFGEAVLRSLPADNGLYMPETIIPLDDAFWKSWKSMSFSDMAYEVVSTLLQGAIPTEDLRNIIDDALNFPAPTVRLDDQHHVLELFHGPTLAFKDFGARFMARVMAWLTRNSDDPLTVLVATSGDTGGAVASAFHHVEGTRVVILYPSGKVSGLQEKQLTALGGNITALEVDGSFDDCQHMVKSAFLDQETARKHNLTSANSINITRLIPQMLYYFESARQFDTPPVFVIPSGNFGNLTACLIAMNMGLQVKQLVAATNVNDVVPEYLASATYNPRPSVPTLSNAMDVGAPSNFTRMLELFGNDWGAMTETVSGFAFDDQETRDAMRQVHEQYGYTIDPHGAVGYLASEAWLTAHPEDTTIILETAHPAKFPETVGEELGANAVEIPERLACLANEPKVSIPMAAKPQALIDWLQA